MTIASKRKARKTPSNLSPSGKTLRSIPGHCIVCGRSDVDLVAYTSSRSRLFCHRDHAVTEALRTFRYCASTGHDATTVLAHNHHRLIEWLDGKLSAEDIARMVIYAEYGELPKR
jgi:hypothetical protein